MVIIVGINPIKIERIFYKIKFIFIRFLTALWSFAGLLHLVLEPLPSTSSIISFVTVVFLAVPCTNGSLILFKHWPVEHNIILLECDPRLIFGLLDERKF